MEIDKLINKLHPLERKVLPVLNKIKDFDEIVKESGLKGVEVMRALQWLSNKDVLNIKEELEEVIILGENAKEVLETLRGHFQELVFETVIKETVKFKESSVDGTPILEYAKNSEAAEEYRSLAREVMSGG